ncbi:hypothetical protein BDZ89DRAFT_1072856, partial [Hymenopellis radicata]
MSPPYSPCSPPQSPDSDDTDLAETPTSILSGDGSSLLDDAEEVPVITGATQKKKKKKKAKKSGKNKADSASANTADSAGNDGQHPVLRISRNKHWRYISSYHGPWLQLPIELLDSLLVLNLDPATFASESRMPSVTASPTSPAPNRIQDRVFNDDSPRSSSAFAQLPMPAPIPPPKPGKATPPPIDPGVFRNVTSIRRLIDEAAELSVRATSGLSAAELRGGGGGGGINGSPWAAAQTLGINPMGNIGGNGRNVAMSAMRIHRLRALAVQKLAEAYKADEIASSVMVMQGGSVFDDVAERVLKVDPNDIDAKYVHFFHEKIPSRQLAESTTTQVLDDLIRAQPQRLEFYRTRGIVHCFRDEYQQATRDFTFALKESRAQRKARMSHNDRAAASSESRTNRGRKKKKGNGGGRSNGQAPPNGTSVPDTPDVLDGEPLLIHPSVLPDAPDPIEPQLLFLRGSAYLQHAVFLIETAVLKLEGIRKGPSIDGAELRLCYIEDGKYGGVEIGHPDGPLGKSGGPKVTAYRQSIRDHEKFISHFDTLETSDVFFDPDRDIAQRNPAPPPLTDTPPMFTTYHPLLVESHFSILICQLMLADFVGVLPTFIHTAALVDGLEGYPVFLPPRSMAQAEFIEVLERLAGGWKNGIQPHSLTKGRSKGRLTIEPATPIFSDGAGSSSSSSSSPPPSPSQDMEEVLDSARILLAPDRAETAAAEKSAGTKKKPTPINIPLHGPRVEVILAWLGAVHLPEL